MQTFWPFDDQRVARGDARQYRDVRSAIHAETHGAALDSSIANQEDKRSIRIGAHRAPGEERYRLRPLVFPLIFCRWPLILQERHFHARVRQNKIVFFLIHDSDTHFDSSLL